MVLIPQVRQAVSLPLIAAGGIGNGAQMAAAFALGADGVQVGSRFAATHESSGHINFKQAIVAAREGDTQLSLKQLTPVRLIKNKFFQEVDAAEKRGATPDELKALLGRARAKKGMFEGDLDEGELEIGQVSGEIDSILPAKTVMEELIRDYNIAIGKLKPL